MAENLDKNWMGSGTDEEEIYKENIIDHFKNPHNFGVLSDYTIRHRELNPLCGDNFELFMKVDNDRITDIKFKGNGCAISTAATSMLTDKIKDMSIDELNKITSEEILEMVGIPLGIVRRKCGLLCLKILKGGLEEFGGIEHGQTIN